MGKHRSDRINWRGELWDFMQQTTRSESPPRHIKLQEALLTSFLLSSNSLSNSTFVSLVLMGITDWYIHIGRTGLLSPVLRKPSLISIRMFSRLTTSRTIWRKIGWWTSDYANLTWRGTNAMQRSGSAKPSLVQNAINSCGGIDSVSAEDEHDIRGLAGILYGGEFLSAYFHYALIFWWWFSWSRNGQCFHSYSWFFINIII